MNQSHTNLGAVTLRVEERRKAQRRRAIQSRLGTLTGKTIGFIATLILPQVLFILEWIVLNRRKQTTVHQHDTCHARSTPCGFVGNADFYGLGQRLAIYMQWTGCLAARALLPAAEKTIQTSAAGFALVTAVALFWQLTQRDQCFYAAELFVILQLFIATKGHCLSSSVRRFHARGLKYGRNPFACMQGTELMSLLLVKIVDPFEAWFWMQLGYGTSAMAATPCGTSAVFTFPWLVWLRIDPLQSPKTAIFIAWFTLFRLLGEVSLSAAVQARQKGHFRLASILEATELSFWVVSLQKFVRDLTLVIFVGLGHLPAAMLLRLHDYRSWLAESDWERSAYV